MRLHALDSLRGLAALLVMVGHLYYTLPEPSRVALWWVNKTPLALLAANTLPVLLFFVLSGFVLALPFIEGRDESYPAFLIRRFCRIYVPFAAAVCGAALLCHLVAGAPLAAEGNLAFLNHFWARPVDAPTLMAHLFMLGIETDSTRLDTVIWSLVYEIRLSILFPFVFLAVQRFQGRCVAAAVVLGLVALKIVHLRGGTSNQFADDAWGSLLLTIHYIPCFAVGIYLALHKDRLPAFVKAMPPALQAAAWIAAASVIIFASHSGWSDTLLTFVAAYVMAFCLSSPTAHSLLSRAPCLWLGRVSYSLYLIHFPIMLTIFYMAPKLGLPMTGVWLLTVSLALPLAELHYRLIESPALQLGKKLAAGMAATQTKNMLRQTP